MIDIVVRRAVLVPGPGGEGQWRLSIESTDEDGVTEQGVALLPADAVEWRMAQFNVDAQTAANLAVTRRFTGIKDNVYDDEPTRSAARQLAISHMQQATTITWSRPAAAKPPPDELEADPDAVADSVEGGDPLATFVAHSPVDEDVVAVKREWLDGKRAARRQRGENQAARQAQARARRQAGDRPALHRPSAAEVRERLIDAKRPRPPVEGSGPADIRTKETHWRQ